MAEEREREEEREGEREGGGGGGAHLQQGVRLEEDILHVLHALAAAD